MPSLKSAFFPIRRVEFDVLISIDHPFTVSTISFGLLGDTYCPMLFPIPSRPFAKIFPRDIGRCSWRCYSFIRKSPLRVLFCGSDEFSISGLRALNDLRQTTNDPSVFGSIDVVCRPSKRTGRGLKTLRESKKIFTFQNKLTNISSAY